MASAMAIDRDIAVSKKFDRMVERACTDSSLRDYTVSYDDVRKFARYSCWHSNIPDAPSVLFVPASHAAAVRSTAFRCIRIIYVIM